MTQRTCFHRLVVVTVVLIGSASPARADIFQWEYINPADPSQGKQQSTTLARDGARVDAVPGANLWQLNLTMAYLIGADLTGAYGYRTILTNAALNEANLTNAYFHGATLTGVDFSDAEVRGATFAIDRNFLGGISFPLGTGITLAQLYSTASYQAHDLTGIQLWYSNLAGGNFAGQNLTNVNFAAATLSGADFREANLSDVTFDAANLTGANFAGQNLTNANFHATTLTGADFNGAEIRGANFAKDYYSSNGTGITCAQLYSTASYQAGDLSGINLGLNDLTGGNFAGQNLTNVNFSGATLTGADFRGANLTNARVGGILTGADFTDAEVRGASLSPATLAQLYSTASYQAHDLTGIGLGGNDLSGGNFAGQNLTNAHFYSSTLTGADFTNAEVRGAGFNAGGTGLTTTQLYSTASYQAHDLTAIRLIDNVSGWNFAGQNLTNATFYAATLTEADFTGAEVRGANFSLGDVCGDYCYPTGTGTGIALAQLYSTTNFQASDLRGLQLSGNDLTGGNFAGQNLTNAGFFFATLIAADFRQANLTNVFFAGADLTGANFRQANLANASFASGRGIYLVYATLADADFTAADARGAYLYEVPTGAFTMNLIRPDGHIDGLDLEAGSLLLVRDYDGRPEYGPSNPPIPITVDQHLAMDRDGTLRMVFEADAWDSTISFAPGIPVTLGGTLELTFANDVNLTSQVGRTFDLFDWTGVTPTGAFAISGPYAWDLSNLYATGEITLAAIPEPASVALAAVSAFSLTFYRRRKIS